MIRLFIADDHPIIRRGLKEILSSDPDIVVCGEAGSVPELLELLRERQHDVLVLDITMPGRSGFEVLRELKQEHRSLPVLVLSMHPEDQFAVRALRAGAAGYMTKESAPEELVRAIRKVHAGGMYVSPTLAEKLAGDLSRGTGRPLHEALSDREFEVMCLIASGLTVKEIAQQLSLSVKTVSTHRARALEKLGMATNAQWTRYAIEHSLV